MPARQFAFLPERWSEYSAPEPIEQPSWGISKGEPSAAAFVEERLPDAEQVSTEDAVKSAEGWR
jgi:hypothetical protein